MDQVSQNALSIQSHVVHGYVGNRAAVYPLELRGWDVDALNTVQFSNNTGYGSHEGTVTSPAELLSMYSGLMAHNFEYHALLTGFTPGPEGVRALGEIGRSLCTRNPNLIWLLDPVLGDEGRWYVSKETLNEYQDILKMGIVTIVTPNYFEAELLTGIPLVDRVSTIASIRKLHNEYFLRYVVISSLKLDGKLLTIGSVAGHEPFFFECDEIDSYFTGTGDLFAAVLLDCFWRSNKSNDGFKDALGATVSVVGAVLKRTYEYGKAFGVTKTPIHDSSMQYHELRLVQSTQEFLNLNLNNAGRHAQIL